MENAKKLFALALCALLVLSVLFSASFVSHEADHDCGGEDCQICAMINKCTELLGDALTSVAGAAIFGILVYSLCRVTGGLGISSLFFTPVRLKVKLTD